MLSATDFLNAGLTPDTQIASGVLGAHGAAKVDQQSLLQATTSIASGLNSVHQQFTQDGTELATQVAASLAQNVDAQLFSSQQIGQFQQQSNLLEQVYSNQLDVEV